MNPKIILFVLTFLSISSCATTSEFLNDHGWSSSSPTKTASAAPAAPANFVADNRIWNASTDETWNKLQTVHLKALESAQTSDANTTAWIKLAIISKRYSTNTHDLTAQLIAWRAENPNHPANALFPDNTTLQNLQNEPAPKKIGLLLPLDGKYGQSGKIIREGFLGGYYKSSTNQTTATSFYDTSKNDAAALYNQAVSQGSDRVVGPLLKESVQTLSQQNSYSAPLLTLNYADNNSAPNNFYQFGLSPHDEANQVAEKAAQAGLSKALLIAPDTQWGRDVSKTLASRFQSMGGTVVDSLYFDSKSNLNLAVAHLLGINPKVDTDKTREDNSKENLQKQRRQDFDVVFMLAPPIDARQIVPLLRFYYVENTPIYSTSIVYSGIPSPQKDRDLNGVMFCDIPWILKTDGKHSNRLYAVGLDSYLLSHELNRLNTLPNFPIYGATGALTLTPQHQIHRRLAWAKFHDGMP